MILGGWLIGLSTFDYAISSPESRSYSNIKVYGGNTIIDKLHIYNTIKTDDFIASVSTTVPHVWTTDTILLAEFTYTLDGGNVINLPTALTGWEIYRREVGATTNALITTVPAGTMQYVDYGVSAYKTYTYELIPITATSIGAPVIPDNIYTDFFGWYLMDYDNPTTVYKFDLDVKSGTLSNEVDVTTHQNYTQFPSVAQGDRNYIRGEFSCLAGAIDCGTGEIIQPSEYLETFRAFINNKRPKTFKSRKGDLWKVLTYGCNIEYMDEIQQQPATIQFSFCQIA